MMDREKNTTNPSFLRPWQWKRPASPLLGKDEDRKRTRRDGEVKQPRGKVCALLLTLIKQTEQIRSVRNEIWRCGNNVKLWSGDGSSPLHERGDPEFIMRHPPNVNPFEFKPFCDERNTLGNVDEVAAKHPTTTSDVITGNAVDIQTVKTGVDDVGEVRLTAEEKKRECDEEENEQDIVGDSNARNFREAKNGKKLRVDVKAAMLVKATDDTFLNSPDCVWDLPPIPPHIIDNAKRSMKAGRSREDKGLRKKHRGLLLLCSVGNSAV